MHDDGFVTCLCVATDEHTLVRAGEDKLPGSSFALSLEKVWEVIRDQKDLNLPAHKVSYMQSRRRRRWIGK